eukprot:20288-Rhodomonas_salina.1
MQETIFPVDFAPGMRFFVFYSDVRMLSGRLVSPPRNQWRDAAFGAQFVPGKRRFAFDFVRVGGGGDLRATERGREGGSMKPRIVLRIRYNMSGPDVGMVLPGGW